MRGKIEKKNNILVTGFTMYQTASGENRSFLLDSIVMLNVNDPE